MSKKTLIWVASCALAAITLFACTGDLEDKIDELNEKVTQLQNSFNKQKQDLLAKFEELKKQNSLNEKELKKLDGVIKTLEILDRRTKSDSIQLVELKKELASTKVSVEILERISKTYYGDINLQSISNSNAYDRYDYLNGNLTLDNRSGSIYVRFKFREITGALHLINVRKNWNNLDSWFFYLEKVRSLWIEDSTHPTLSYLNKLKYVRIVRLTDNPDLISLEGLENIEGSIWFFMAENNTKLSNFCALKTQFTTNPPSSWYVSGNAYNPTIDQIKNGKCKL